MIDAKKSVPVETKVTVTAPGGKDLEATLRADLQALTDLRRADTGAADPELEALLNAIPKLNGSLGLAPEIPSPKTEAQLHNERVDVVEQLQALQTDITILDDTVGQLIDEVNERIDGLVTPNRVEALRGSVALHAAINYKSHGVSVSAAVTATADTLLAWLVKE